MKPDTVLLTEAEWTELANGYLKRLKEVVALDAGAAVIEQDGEKFMAIPLASIKPYIKVGIQNGVQPQTPFERQFVALCMGVNR